MKPTTRDDGPVIDPSMTILDVLILDRRTEAVFRAHGDRAGVCLCCEALFDPLESLASTHGVNVGELLLDLEARLNAPPDEAGDDSSPSPPGNS